MLNFINQNFKNWFVVYIFPRIIICDWCIDVQKLNNDYEYLLYVSI